MAERVVVYQDKTFRTSFQAADPSEEDTSVVETVMHLHNLTPYGMLLASLGACTAIVVNTYAMNHGIPLRGVSVDARYERVFMDDCEDCDGDNEYEEVILENVEFEGDFDESQRKRLHQVVKACSVRRLLEKGIRIISD
jgi:putative redox protein